MIAKMILPWFGGSAAVWITAMLFFQSALLGGYLYAHWLIKCLRPRTQALTHVLLLGASLLLLPAAPNIFWKPSGNEEPILRILALLTFSIGLPYLLLSTTSPLIQAWHSRRHKAILPYRLFALSNFASLAGLLAYPVLIEPNVTLRHQSLGWSSLYAAFVALASLAAWGSRGAQQTDAMTDQPLVEAEERSPSRREMTLWFLLAAGASTLLLAVTNHLTQNVASIPFLWVLPLSLYLLTFILTFDFERLYNRAIFIWLLAAALAGMAYGVRQWNSHTSLRIVIPAFAAGLFVSCMFCHGELVKRKPAPRHLTWFYLMLSLGGAFGGLLVGVVAPNILPANFELPIALGSCAILLLFLLEYRKHTAATYAAWGAAVAVLIMGGMYIKGYNESALAMERNFYGGLRVNEYDKNTEDENRMLVHGTVDHGMQLTAPERRRERITYYGPGSGIGLSLDSFKKSKKRIGVIGLGAGSLAAYAEHGDVIRFYEINPLVEKIARTWFTYLSDCPGKVEIVLGDGRLSLEREAPRQYDVLAVDAFSGDAVPVHLLTRQAIDVYFRHLNPDGILALHITNTHLDLAPVVEKLAKSAGKHSILILQEPDAENNIYSSRWALLSSKPFTQPALLEAGEELPEKPDLAVWTDDYNNLFQILK